MELRQLEFFLMVSKLNSFTRAAERLYVSQPAVTAAIRSLEDELDIQLFDRSKKNVVLTAEGQVFQKHVENVMHNVSETILGISEMKNLNRGTIHLGVPPMVGATLLPEIITLFSAKYPSLQVILCEETPASILNRLEAGELDIAFTLDAESSPTCEIREIATIELATCFQSQNQKQRHAPFAISELNNQELVLMSEGCPARKKLLASFQELNLKQKSIFESAHLQTVLALVAKGAGISVLPKTMVDYDHRICSVPLLPPLQLSVGLAQKRGRHVSYAVRTLLDFIVGLSRNAKQG